MSGKRKAADQTPGGKPPKKKKGLLRRILTWMLMLVLAMTLIGLASFVYLYQTTDLPDPNKDFQTQTTNIYYENGKTELGEFATQKRESITLDEMPDTLKDAVVAAENKTFWTDRGIDPKGILRAAFSNAQGNARQGASTITQQYVKVAYLSQERTISRKLKEAFLALKIQRQMSKSEILEGYLNTIYFGRGAYGVETAAQAFFNKPAKKLNLRQSAVLASVVNNPTGMDPANGPEARDRLRARYEYALNSMVKMGTATAEEAEKAAKKLPKFPKVKEDSQYGGQRGHALKLVKDELLRLGFTEEEVNGGGLKVTTTLSEKAMDAAKEGVLEERPDLSDKEMHIGVASVEPGTGALRGFYGGQDYLKSQINWAYAGGMAGSTLKPFAVATGLKEGFSLKDSFDGNSPYLLDDGGDVENQGDTSYGQVSLLTATENSINTAFIDLTLAMEDGPRKIIKTANDMGIPSKGGSNYGFPRKTPGLEPVTGVALGSAVVSPINMANAYATIANEGVWSEPYLIEKVVDHDGKVRYNHRVKNRKVLDPDIAADVSYALQQVVSSGSGTAALSLNRPAAGKTGTATTADGGVSSAWFTGYTPQMATSVVYLRGKGNGNLEGFLPEFYGGSYPARTWTSVMTRAMEGLDVLDFPEPAFVDGEAPASGHEPYVPPPTNTPTKKPTKKPTKEPTQEPSQEPSQEPTPTPTPTPSPSDPTPTIIPPPEPEPTPTESQRPERPARTERTPAGG